MVPLLCRLDAASSGGATVNFLVQITYSRGEKFPEEMRRLTFIWWLRVVIGRIAHAKTKRRFAPAWFWLTLIADSLFRLTAHCLEKFKVQSSKSKSKSMSMRPLGTFHNLWVGRRSMSDCSKS